MWGNIGITKVTGFVQGAIQNVQKLSQELEAQMDAAVAENDEVEKETKKGNSPTTTNSDGNERGGVILNADDDIDEICDDGSQLKLTNTVAAAGMMQTADARISTYGEREAEGKGKQTAVTHELSKNADAEKISRAEKRAARERAAREKMEQRQATRSKNERVAAEQAEQERLAAEQAELAHLAAEQEEQNGLAAEQEEQDRLAAEKEEQDRLAAEQLEQARLAAEQEEQARLAAEQEEHARLAAEQEEQARLAAEQLEQARLAAEQEEQARLAAEQEEHARLAAEQEEQARLAAEQVEQDRLTAEQLEQARLAAEQLEQARLAAEQEEQNGLAAEQEEQDRLAAEKEEQDRLAAEQLEQARLAAEREEQARLAAEQAEQARLAAEQLEQARLAAEQEEQARLAATQEEQARLAAEQEALVRLAAEQAEHTRLAAAQEEQARLAAEQEEQARLAAEQEEQDRLTAEQEKQDRLTAEQEKQDRLTAEQVEQDRLTAEQEEQDRLTAEREEQDRLIAEREEQDRLIAEREEQDRLIAEREEQARLAAEQEKARLTSEHEEQARLATKQAEQAEMIDPHPVQNPALGVVGRMQDGMRSPPVTISKKAKKAKAKREQVRLDGEEQERKREIDSERTFEAGQRECVEKEKEHARLQADRVKQEEEYRLQMETQRLESERQLNEKQVELTVELQKLAERHASKVAAAEQKLDALTASHCLDLEELRTHMQADMDSRENAWHIDKERLRHALQESADMVSILEERVEQLTADVARGEDKFSKAQQKLSEQMQEEINRLAEVVTQRERSLQSSNEQLSDLTRQNEDLVAKVTALTQTAEDYKARNKQLQMTSAGESDMRRELSKLQEDVREKDASLAAFRVEGQALAKKQSDMEKNVRNSRKEVREKEAEIAKLKEVRDQYVKTIEEMQDVIRQNEATAVSSQKQMSVMQAVSQASQDKITKLEADIQSMAEEISSQRRAMESAWNENSELKRKVTDLNAEKEDLRGQLGMGASKANETESFRRDLEQREAILRATNKQLQDSLQRQMNESSNREERMREELSETRRRWQEAITSREALASEVGGATTPLLRQITALQETLRVKTDNWQKMESALSERAMRAESSAESAEARRQVLEEENAGLRMKLKSAQSRLEEFQEQLHLAEVSMERAKRCENELTDRVSKLQTALNEESSLRIAVENRSRDMQARQKRITDQMNEEHEAIVSRNEDLVKSLSAELEDLKNQLGRTEDKKSPESFGTESDISRSNTTTPQTSHSSRPTRNSTPKAAAALLGGDSSYAVSERNSQLRLQRDEKIEDLLRQIQQMQTSRDALLDEVSFLSSKVSELEDSLASYPSVMAENSFLHDRNDALLLLLGEKEEELESLVQDMQDVKSLYRGEIEHLLSKVIPAASNDSGDAASTAELRPIM